ncbi:hypothetical protein SAY86_003847 [Trapa natans]|uniref:Zinc finger PHD-type domain-containing protein n=1 Tax=Trapa natans TaxID=22666 RepID=A0AAN7MDH3_TRANT|nr:hypothetical protein SAY86_003847 [Trapa natans]
MDSSEDEAEKLPELVSNYYFLDHEDEPISFSGLPLMWSEHEEVIPDGDALKDGLFLHGSADKGLRTIFKEVRAWKIELNNVSPEIYVLSKENTWLKLQKPRKCYEDTIRSVLITVNSLHYLKRNPEASAKSLWNYMANVFSMYEVRPAAKDLGNHMSLISEAVKRDDSIAKCKLIASFLGENSLLKKLSSEDDQIMPKPGFIAEDDKINAVEDSLDTEEEEEDVFDYVCSICDNGGKLLCCEGRCMRSFHPTIESGEDSVCESLGFTDAEVEAIQQFICRNCECKQHQCYACGNLGSSDKSSGAEVFACVSATCGRFYHPNCVAELLHPGDEDAAKELQKTIAEGKSFTCPIHKCCVCGKGENKRTPELQFAVCRRCPRSYHRKCLPREVTFEDSTDEDVITRAWEGLLPNRVLIYCLKHELDEQLRTPVRNHIKFPHLNEEKTAVCVNRKRQQPELSSSTGKKFVEKKCSASDEYVSRASTKRTDRKERLSSPADRNIKSKKSKVLSQQEISKKEKMENVCGQSSKNSKKVMLEGKSSSAKKKEDNVSLGQLSYPSYMEGSESELVQHEKEDRSLGSETASKKLDSLPKLDAESERRIHDIIKDAASSLSMKDVLGKHKNPSTHTRFLKSNVDKAITLGKLEGAVEALRTALQKIEEGVSIEDAQAVCDPDVLNQIFKWKDKLKVYLSPFIFGMRYTSFGRHFTKVDKLQEVNSGIS